MTRVLSAAITFQTAKFLDYTTQLLLYLHPYLYQKAFFRSNKYSEGYFERLKRDFVICLLIDSFLSLLHFHLKIHYQQCLSCRSLYLQAAFPPWKASRFSGTLHPKFHFCRCPFIAICGFRRTKKLKEYSGSLAWPSSALKLLKTSITFWPVRKCLWHDFTALECVFDHSQFHSYEEEVVVWSASGWRRFFLCLLTPVEPWTNVWRELLKKRISVSTDVTRSRRGTLCQSTVTFLYKVGQFHYLLEPCESVGSTDVDINMYIHSLIKLRSENSLRKSTTESYLISIKQLTNG